MTYLFFVQLLEYLLLFEDDNMNKENQFFSNSESSASGCFLALLDFLPISASRS